MLVRLPSVTGSPGCVESRGSESVEADFVDDAIESLVNDIAVERKEWPGVGPATPGCAVWQRCGLGCPLARSRQFVGTAVTVAVLPAQVAR